MVEIVLIKRCDFFFFFMILHSQRRNSQHSKTDIIQNLLPSLIIKCELTSFTKATLIGIIFTFLLTRLLFYQDITIVAFPHASRVKSIILPSSLKSME